MTHNQKRFDITPKILLKAYACGMFPMAENAEDPTIHWIEPHARGVIPLDSFHMSRSLSKVVRQSRFKIKIDNDFQAVIKLCAQSTLGREKTWINDKICNLYTRLHEAGHAHSVEAWLEGEMVGGLYGVRLGTAFFGESMFHRATDASKVCLVHLVARLIYGGFTLLDAQFITAHLSRFGAVEIPRDEYLQKLQASLGKEANFFAMPQLATAQQVLDIIKSHQH